MRVRAANVFTPGAFPVYTYVERRSDGLEKRLHDGLETPGQVISLAGPSKSGKTVLVEKVVGAENLIAITGAGIKSAEQIWEKVLDWIEAPAETAQSNTKSISASGGAEVQAGGSIFGLMKGETTASGSVEVGSDSERSQTHQRLGLKQVAKEIANSSFVLLIDDFHYMPRDVQLEAAKQIKEAVRLGIKICTASVPHRSDDVVRANPELRGRVLALDLEYWKKADLRAIADLGFSKLGVKLDDKTLGIFSVEAAGSPQLMQSICLNACFELDIREAFDRSEARDVADDKRDQMLERTASVTDFRSLVDVLDSGPKTRGTERKTYRFKDKTDGDVYRCLLRAMAADPPQLSFDYSNLMHRVQELCQDDQPTGSSIIGSCSQMSKLAEEKFPAERVIDWDDQKQVFDIPDPYLLFYLRWSGKLFEDYD